MPAIVHQLRPDSEDYQYLYNASGYFLEGECYAFAIALHQGLGWPLVGLIKSYDETMKASNVIWHAGVRTPSGQLFDVRGPQSEEVFGEFFLPAPHTLRDIQVEELYQTRPVDDFIIKRARQLAEIFWPELPWQESAAARVKAFAEVLEKLSKEHGFWVAGFVPANLPRLFAGFGDEGGYEIERTCDGLSFTINRYLEP